MKQLVKESGALTLVSIGEIVVRFVRTKFIALFLGPVGLGFLAQLTNFFETLRIFGDLGARQAVVRQIAETGHIGGRNSEQYKNVISTSFVIASVVSFLATALVTLFARPISQLLYGKNDAAIFVIVISGLLPIASITAVIGAIVKGNRDFFPFTKCNLAAHFILVLLTPFLLRWFGYWGAIAVQGLFFLLPLLGFLIMNFKDPFLRFSKTIHLHLVRYQLGDGGLQVYLMILSQAVRVGISALIIRTLGLEQMGVYQVAVAFSTVYLAIPSQSMSSYLFPVIAAAKDPEEANQAVNDSFRFVVFLLLPVVVALMLVPEIFIRIFFSEKFLNSIDILRIQLFYALAVIVCGSFSSAIWAKRHLKAIFWVTTMHTLTLFVLFFPFFRWWGLMGVAGAFVGSGVVMAVLYLVLAKRSLNMYLYPKNKRLIVASALWFLIATVAGFLHIGLIWRIGILFFGIPWFLGSTKGHERKFLFNKALAWLRKSNADKS